MFEIFKPKCGVCQKKIKGEPAKLILETIDGDIEYTVCESCEKDLRRIADVGDAMRSELG
jgi:ribosome-binding protein aMBF1 (putative translation factor)